MELLRGCLCYEFKHKNPIKSGYYDMKIFIFYIYNYDQVEKFIIGNFKGK
jgi:hypothetical protein